MAHAPKQVQQRQRPGSTVERLLKDGDTAGAKAELERLLLEGLDTGPSVEATPQFWADLRTRLHREASAHKSKKSA